MWQDDFGRWYGELLRLCKDVVAAMHIMECKVIAPPRTHEKPTGIGAQRFSMEVRMRCCRPCCHRCSVILALAQGVAKDFNPATCDCEPLDLIVTTALERADAYLKQAGPDHPVFKTMQNHAGHERALRNAWIDLIRHSVCPLVLLSDMPQARAGAPDAAGGIERLASCSR